MTAPFVTQLRTEDEAIAVGAGGTTLHLRVQAAELWDTVRIDAADTSAVSDVKAASLKEFYPSGETGKNFVVKLRGFEILDESETLAAAGIKDGSTLLLAARRRRPVR